jgi:hypothetical protein
MLKRKSNNKPENSVISLILTKSFAASFTAGYISGIFEEFLSLLQTNKFSYDLLASPKFRDLCFISRW